MSHQQQLLSFHSYFAQRWNPLLPIPAFRTPSHSTHIQHWFPPVQLDWTWKAKLPNGWDTNARKDPLICGQSCARWSLCSSMIKVLGLVILAPSLKSSKCHSSKLTLTILKTFLIEYRDSLSLHPLVSWTTYNMSYNRFICARWSTLRIWNWCLKRSCHQHITHHLNLWSIHIRQHPHVGPFLLVLSNTLEEQKCHHEAGLSFNCNVHYHWDGCPRLLLAFYILRQSTLCLTQLLPKSPSLCTRLTRMLLR